MKKSIKKKPAYKNNSNIREIVIDSAIDFMIGYKNGDIESMSQFLNKHPSLINYLSNKTTSEVYGNLLFQDNELSDAFYNAVSYNGRIEQYNRIVDIHNSHYINDSKRPKKLKVIKRKR